MYFDNDGDGSVSDKKPLRSCLKRESTVDLKASPGATPSPNKKRITFNFDDPPIVRPLATDNSKKPLRYERPIVMGAFEHRAYITGDLTCLAYERIKNALNDALRPRVLVCYQPGVTKQYIEYMLKYAWPVENANDEPISIVTKYLEPSLVECVEDESCVYIFWRPDHVQCRNICERFQYYHKAVALILGDVNLMVQLPEEVDSKGSLPSFDKHVLRLAVTVHDMTRQGAYYREPSLRESLLNETGGIPSLLEKTQESLAYGWIGQNKIFGRLFILMTINHPIEPHWRELKTGLSMLDLASACGFTFIRKSVNEPNRSINVLAESMKLVLCEKLKSLYCELNSKVERLIHPTESPWKVMENIIVQNIQTVDPNQKKQPFKVRFPFLATSFVADLLHGVSGSMKGPKVTLKATASKKNYHKKYRNGPPDQLHPDDWKYYLPGIPTNMAIYPLDISHGPDAYVTLVQDTEDKQVHYMLCFQAKHGSQDLALSEVLDELAKCPQVYVTGQSKGKRILAYDKHFMHESGRSIEYKLTFVYAAMNHANAALRLQREGKCEVHKGYLRCTHNLFPESIPEDVELILLLQQGLKELLGSDMYSHLKSFRPLKAIRSMLEVYDHPALEFLQFRDSDNKEAALSEISRISRSYKKLNIDLSGIKITPRPQTSSGANSDAPMDEVNMSSILEDERSRSASNASYHSRATIITSSTESDVSDRAEQNSAGSQRLSEESDLVFALCAEVQRLKSDLENNKAREKKNDENNLVFALRAECQRLTAELEKNKARAKKNEAREREPIPAVTPTLKEALAGSTPAKTQLKVGSPSTAKPKKNPYHHVQSKVMAYVSESKEKKEADKRGRGGVKSSNTNSRANNTNAPK